MPEVRIIAPSKGLKKEDTSLIQKITPYFKKLGYTVTLGKHLFERDPYFGCPSTPNRVEDLMDAYKDPNVQIIVCASGGYSVNQILPYLDYDLIQKNPKMIVGYSDITALLIAIMVQTKQITYYGPMLKTFCTENPYTLENFEKILQNKSIELTPSKEFIDYEKVEGDIQMVTRKNEGWIGIQEGSAEGKIVGGNLCTLNLLQGTDYQPDLKDVILFIEDDADDFGNDVFLLEFDRNLESLLQVKGADIKGIVFGRFQLCSHMTIEKVKTLVQNKEKLKGIPIVANADFGHTSPMMTVPLGGYAHLSVTKKEIKINISI